MTKFILPNGLDLLDEIPDLILTNNYDNLFWGIEASLPYSLFNSKVNNNDQYIFLNYYQIVEIIRNYHEISENMCLFDFGNLLLDKYDYEDNYGKIIFEEYADKKNIFFEVADINFIDFLISRYPSIQIILHENYTIFHDDKTIQDIIKKYPNNIKAINITILHLCENIDIPKIGILNLDSCYYCPQFPLCLNTENRNILRYRKASAFNECTKKKMIDIDSIMENLSILLKNTDIILFNTIPALQKKIYLDLIEQFLKREKEVNKE